MRLAQPRSLRSRAGFTLIELLVVIAIIGVLVALLASAAMQLIVFADVMKIVTEIDQLAQGCEQFKQKYGRYPPSLIRLREAGDYHTDPSDPLVNALDVYSKQYLEAIFTGIDLTAGHDWNGDGTADMSGNSTFLVQGDECLVYFLGGIQRFDPLSGGFVLDGFCTDNTQPTIATPGRGRNKFFEFDRSRLADRNDQRINPPTINPGRQNLFIVYLDRFDTPYAYFAAGTPSNVDNYWGTPNIWGLGVPYAEFPPPLSSDRDGDSMPGELNDCPLLCTRRFIPYWTDPTPLQSPQSQMGQGINPPIWPVAPGPYGDVFDWQNIPPGVPGGSTRFHKPDKFQIVSAGRDRIFGVGGPAPLPPIGADPSGTDYWANDRDNITNFSGGKLDTFQR